MPDVVDEATSPTARDSLPRPLPKLSLVVHGTLNGFTSPTELPSMKLDCRTIACILFASMIATTSIAAEPVSIESQADVVSVCKGRHATIASLPRGFA